MYGLGPSGIHFRQNPSVHITTITYILTYIRTYVHTYTHFSVNNFNKPGVPTAGPHLV